HSQMKLLLPLQIGDVLTDHRGRFRGPRERRFVRAGGLTPRRSGWQRRTARFGRPLSLPAYQEGRGQDAQGQTQATGPRHVAVPKGRTCDCFAIRRSIYPPPSSTARKYGATTPLPRAGAIPERKRAMASVLATPLHPPTTGSPTKMTLTPAYFLM